MTRLHNGFQIFMSSFLGVSDFLFVMPSLVGTAVRFSFGVNLLDISPSNKS